MIQLQYHTISEKAWHDTFKNLQIKDLITYTMSEKFTGSGSLIVTLREPTRQDIKQIGTSIKHYESNLKSVNSVVLTCHHQRNTKSNAKFIVSMDRGWGLIIQAKCTGRNTSVHGCAPCLMSSCWRCAMCAVHLLRLHLGPECEDLHSIYYVLLITVPPSSFEHR